MTGVLPSRIPNIINLLINDGPGIFDWKSEPGKERFHLAAWPAGASQLSLSASDSDQAALPPAVFRPPHYQRPPTDRPAPGLKLSVILLPVFTSVPILGRLIQVASSLRRSAAKSSSAPAAQATLDDAPNPPSWFSHLPSPKATPQGISVEELHAALQEEGQEVVLVVDVRRADIEAPVNFLIKGAINLPAQTFHATIPELLPLLSKYSKVVFHCSSSNGRGPRCAGWYQDALNKSKKTATQALVLTGGIKAWVAKYGESEEAVVRL